jgi:hypothetical protein
MAENTNITLTAEAWANIVIERWEQKLVRLNVHHSGKLADSFARHVITQAAGSLEKIEFAFEYYGKFVDMGVGNGVHIDDVQESYRKRKPWYSPVFFSQVRKLGELLREKYAYKAQLAILTNIENGKERDS